MEADAVAGIDFELVGERVGDVELRAPLRAGLRSGVGGDKAVDLAVDVVGAQAEGGAEAVGPVQRDVAPDIGGHDVDLVGGDGGGADARGGAVEAGFIQPVEVRVGAEAALGLHAEEFEVAFHLRAHAGGVAALDLFDLVAENGVDEVGEVVEEVQLRLLDIGQHAGVIPFEAGGGDVAAAFAAIGRIDEAIAADRAILDGAKRDLVRGGPVVGVADEAEAQARVAHAPKRRAGCTSDRRCSC